MFIKVLELYFYVCRQAMVRNHKLRGVLWKTMKSKSESWVPLLKLSGAYFLLLLALR